MYDAEGIPKYVYAAKTSKGKNKKPTVNSIVSMNEFLSGKNPTGVTYSGKEYATQMLLKGGQESREYY